MISGKKYTSSIILVGENAASISGRLLFKKIWYAENGSLMNEVQGDEQKLFKQLN